MERFEQKKFSAKEELHNLEKTGEYVFHGSPFKLETLEPRQAFNHEKKEDGSYESIPDGEPAVFASPFADTAIFMAVISRKNAPLGKRSGFSSDNKNHFEFRATKETMDQIGDEANGYVYVFKKDGFEERNHNEVVAYQAVTPIKIIEVRKEDLPSIEIKDF
jgi:hypothetical protein